MTTGTIDAPWEPLSTQGGGDPYLGGGREPRGEHQYVCSTDRVGVIGKLVGGRGHFAINGREVVRTSGLYVLPVEPVSDDDGNVRRPHWFKWTEQRPSDPIVGSLLDATVTSEPSDDDDPVSESYSVVLAVHIASFAFREGVHIGHAWYGPSGVLNTRFSYGGGAIVDEPPLASVGWQTEKDAFAAHRDIASSLRPDR